MRAIDPNERRAKIAQRCVSLFAKVGYKDVTLQMIAEHCGVSRTVLYRYFRDKRKVFDATILYTYGETFAHYVQEAGERATSPVEQLRHLCAISTAALFDKREFVGAVIDFLMQMRRQGQDMSRPVRLYTVGLIRRIHTLIVAGMAAGEIRADINPDLATDLLYAHFESVMTRLAMSDAGEIAELMSRIDQFIALLRRPADAPSF